MAFQPGQSGNPSGGQKREAKFRAALERAIAQDSADRLRNTAEKLLTLASEGEQWAVKELADRLDGKPAQSIAMSGELNINAASMSDDELAAIAAQP